MLVVKNALELALELLPSYHFYPFHLMRRTKVHHLLPDFILSSVSLVVRWLHYCFYPGLLITPDLPSQLPAGLLVLF